MIRNYIIGDVSITNMGIKTYTHVDSHMIMYVRALYMYLEI